MAVEEVVRKMEARHMLVPLDGTAASEAVLPIALALARASGGAVVLLRVADVHPATLPAPAEEALASVREAGAYLEEVRRRPGVAAVKELTTAVWCGPPAAAILGAAGRHGTDLIVMATHGRTGREHEMFGSVAGAVLRESPVPVLVVRPGRGGPGAAGAPGQAGESR